MPPLTNAKIQPQEPKESGQRYFITAEQGYLKADVPSDGAEYKISFYRVHKNYLHRGYGRELLRLAKEHAKHIGAQVITSTNITSDQSAEAMAAVFGYRHLTGGVDPTKVSSLVELFPFITINYPVQQTDPPLRTDVEVITTPLPAVTSPVQRYWTQRHEK